MLKVVLDTNIFVSSIFWKKGNPHKVVELALEGRIQVFISLSMLNELEKILKRDFDEPADMVKRQTNLILEYAKVVEPAIALDVVKDDPDDNMVVECAFACSADYIVTGDKHLLKIGKYGKTKIVRARAFNSLKKTFGTLKFSRTTDEMLKESDEESWDEYP